MAEITSLSATELRDRIRRGEVSSSRAVDAHLARIRERNPRLNAVVTLDEDGARRRAEDADRALEREGPRGPLHGVPVTVKDCWQTSGLRTTAGFPPLRDHVPQRDATVVARLRDAGAVILGKTNLSLLAADWQTDNPVFGPTLSPWDPDRTPGGSSGGGGAAVAARLSPLDVGSDLGGSIRVPAHFCGVYGLKPSDRRVPAFGHVPDWHIPGGNGQGLVRHMGTYGPLARSVADLELCFRAIAGPHPREPDLPPVPARRRAPPDPSSMSVAWSVRFGDVPVSPAVREVVETVTSALGAAGVRIEKIDPPFETEKVWRAWGEIAATELGCGMPLTLRTLFRLNFLARLLRDRSPVQTGLMAGLSLRAKRLSAALAHRDAAARAVDEVLSSHDAWLCPVSATPAFEHRRPGSPVEVQGERVPYTLVVGAHTTPFSVSGHPVVVFPAGVSPGGLPVGLQLVGRRWRDEELLGTAKTVAGVTGARPAVPPGPD